MNEPAKPAATPAPSKSAEGEVEVGLDKQKIVRQAEVGTTIVTAPVGGPGSDEALRKAETLPWYVAYWAEAGSGIAILAGLAWIRAGFHGEHPTPLTTGLIFVVAGVSVLLLAVHHRTKPDAPVPVPVEAEAKPKAAPKG